jgi:predicted DNA-binding transcriptional regulator YafY
MCRAVAARPMSLRNAGNGIAVLHGWALTLDRQMGDPQHSNLAAFHRLTRDIYVQAGDLGFWQGALRDREQAQFAAARDAIQARRRLVIELLYGDYEGGQRTISLFSLIPRDDGGWHASVARHWNIDRADPR